MSWGSMLAYLALAGNAGHPTRLEPLPGLFDNRGVDKSINAVILYNLLIKAIFGIQLLE